MARVIEKSVGTVTRTVLLLALVAPACGPADTPGPDDGPSPESAASIAFTAAPALPGRLRFAGDTLRFAACDDSGSGIEVRDETAEARSLLQELGAGAAGVTVLVRIVNDRITAIRYAGLEGPDCGRLPPEGDLQASGNEPFWNVHIAGDTAVVRTPDEIDGVRYTDGRWSRPPQGGWRFEAAAADGTGTITLDVEEARCADSMSGARYPYRAALVRDGRSMSGCAMEGRAAFR